MFWGLVLKTNKRYSQQVTKAFHVSQAVLDLGSINPNDNDSVVQIWLNTDDTDHLLANVSRQTSHVRLDLAFTEGETVSFYSKGHGTVHLSGYLLPDDDDYGELPFDGDDNEFEADEDEESEEEDVPGASNKKQKAVANKKQVKVAEVENEDEDEDDDDSDDLDFEGLQEELEDEELEEESDDSDSDDDDDEELEEEEEDDSEEEVEAPPAKQAKFDSAKQNGLTNGKVSKKGNEQKQKNQKPEKQEQKHKNQQQQQQKQQQQQQQQNQQQKSTPKTLAGGITIQDLRVGSGPEAKSGRKVSVYYEGRLKSNNKVFDSTKSGDGFKFKLGAGEVIRGWDIGLVGMKVGSKRRITCPPGVAYGAKGAPPQIPGNATLVFDVELRGVN